MLACVTATVKDSGFFLDILPNLGNQAPESRVRPSGIRFFPLHRAVFLPSEGISGLWLSGTVKYRKILPIPLP